MTELETDDTRIQEKTYRGIEGMSISGRFYPEGNSEFNTYYGFFTETEEGLLIELGTVIADRGDLDDNLDQMGVMREIMRSRQKIMT